MTTLVFETPSRLLASSCNDGMCRAESRMARTWKEAMVGRGTLRRAVVTRRAERRRRAVYRDYLMVAMSESMDVIDAKLRIALEHFGIAAEPTDAHVAALRVFGHEISAVRADDAGWDDARTVVIGGVRLFVRLQRMSYTTDEVSFLEKNLF